MIKVKVENDFLLFYDGDTLLSSYKIIYDPVDMIRDIIGKICHIDNISIKKTDDGYTVDIGRF